MIPFILEAALRMLAVALAVWGGLRLLRVSNVWAQKAAWGLVLAAALLMPMLMRWQWLSAAAPIRFTTQLWGLVEKPAQASAPAVATTAIRQESLSSPDSASPLKARRPTAIAPPPAEAVALPAPAAPHATPKSWHWSEYLWLLYLTACALLLARLLYGLLAALWLWRTAEPVSIPPALSVLAVGVRLRSSRRIASPVAIGSGVVLPAEYFQWDAQKLRIVLAHERSHLRQGDFYLQILASLHAVFFWFSPLAWWLKRTLSDLGEALSDRAGLQVAASSSAYAQILLEFAALPRPTLLGVAMASNRSNLSRRMERFLNESSFRQAFTGSRPRVILAVLLVPAILFASTALIRVEAATQTNAAQTSSHITEQAAQTAVQSTPDALLPSPPTPQPVDNMVPPPPLPPLMPLRPLPPPSHHGQNANSGPGFFCATSRDGLTFAVITDSKGEDCFTGDNAKTLNQELAKAHKLTQGKYLWFSRDGKSFIIDDRALTAQMEGITKQMETLGFKQEQLGGQQNQLSAQMDKLSSQMAQLSVPTPEVTKKMADLDKEIAKLAAEQANSKSVEEWADFESKMGNLQGKIGELIGQMGAQKGAQGAKMGDLGTKMGALGAQFGKLGAQQGALSAEAEARMKAIIDQALRDGKAHPCNQ